MGYVASVDVTNEILQPGYDAKLEDEESSSDFELLSTQSSKTIEKILRICSGSYISEERINEFKSKFVYESTVFVEKDGKNPILMRVSYKTITIFISNIKKEKKERSQKKLDTIQNNLNIIIEDYNLDYSFRKLAAKILDHVELCNYQINYVRTQTKNLDKFTEQINSAKNKLKLQKKALEKIHNKLLNQVLVSLSIFTGLAFLLFGGLDTLGNLGQFFENIDSNFSLGIIYISLIGLILLGLIHTFLCFIIRILDKKDSKGEKILLTSFHFWIIFSIFVIVLIIGLGLHFQIK